MTALLSVNAKQNSPTTDVRTKNEAEFTFFPPGATFEKIKTYMHVVTFALMRYFGTNSNGLFFLNIQNI